MNTLITKIEDIKFELEAIQQFLEISISEDMNEVEQRGNELTVYMARSGKLLADAKYHRDEKLNSAIVEELKKILQLAPSTANKYIDALTKEENYLVSWSERVNRTCTHQIDWCRTLISKAKEEMRVSCYIVTGKQIGRAHV